MKHASTHNGNDDDDGRKKKNLKSTLFAWNEYNKFVVVGITNLIEAHGLHVCANAGAVHETYILSKWPTKKRCALVAQLCTVLFASREKKQRGEEEEKDGEEKNRRVKGTELVGKEWIWYICSDLDTVDSQKWHGFFFSSYFFHSSFSSCMYHGINQTLIIAQRVQLNCLTIRECCSRVNSVWLCGLNKLDGPKSKFIPFVYMVIFGMDK